MVERLLSSAGGLGFDSQPCHTKDMKNGTSISLDWHSVLLGKLASFHSYDKQHQEIGVETD